jgi:tyrosine-specific transport protein
MDTTAKTKEGSLLSATLLITGCCIGAGMIGLPVVSALAGFLPATLAMFLCYLFATGTGLLILEATLWFNHEVNLISMAGFALGKLGKVLTWSLFLFLFYCIFVAYIDGGGQLFTALLSTLCHQPVARELGIVACVGFVSLVLFGGTKRVSLLNRLFLAGSALSFCALTSLGMPHIEVNKYLYTNWNALYSALPIMLICFGYQNLIPTLTYYAKRNIATIRIAIFVGNLIPFLIYFVWNSVILGVLPDGNSLALAHIVSQSDLVTSLLEKASQSHSVLFFANTFSFFAIITPFMVNSLAFVDFLKDGLKRSRLSNNNSAIYALVLVPPTLLTLLFPRLFLKALGIAGGFADVLLFGLLPVLIVAIGRYVKKMQGPYTAPGGKIYLVIVLLLSIWFLFI